MKRPPGRPNSRSLKTGVENFPSGEETEISSSWYLWDESKQKMIVEEDGLILHV